MSDAQSGSPSCLWGGSSELGKGFWQLEIVEGEEAQEVACDVQQSELVMSAATSEGNLEVKRDGCRCVEVALCERGEGWKT